MKTNVIEEFKYSILMFIIVIILILIGLERQENYSILKKAVDMCLQCMGIG